MLNGLMALHKIILERTKFIFDRSPLKPLRRYFYNTNKISLLTKTPSSHTTRTLHLSPHLHSSPTMEKAVLLRSLSSTSTLAFSRIFSRSSHRLASYSAKRHRLLQNLYRRRSLIRSNGRLLSPSLDLKRQFYPLSVRAIATSAPQSSQGTPLLAN